MAARTKDMLDPSLAAEFGGTRSVMVAAPSVVVLAAEVSSVVGVDGGVVWVGRTLLEDPPFPAEFWPGDKLASA